MPPPQCFSFSAAVRTKPDSAIPCDLIVLHGSAIVNEAMLSGESTPLLKESIDLRDGTDRLDMNGTDRNNVLFSGTKALQVTAGEGPEGLKAPDGGCLAVVLRTGFGTTQGQLVRTMIFSTEAVTAGNLESFVFIGFLLMFAIAASAYVWIHGVAKGLKKSKLLLDCVLIVTSVVPPELPMELSMAVNASLVALSKYGQSRSRLTSTRSPTLLRLTFVSTSLQPSSALSRSGSRSPVGSMFAALTRLERSLARTSSSRELLVSHLATRRSSSPLPLPPDPRP